ncbi:hypothetical protein ACV22V_12625 [Burkholderia sp. AW33-5]|uniref:hypothetical protein n=1 Tax=Burkholderia TaxID=32008 RepID=UPI0013969E97|nr:MULTISPECIES: hypothetical protein [Burkholderia]
MMMNSVVPMAKALIASASNGMGMTFSEKAADAASGPYRTAQEAGCARIVPNTPIFDNWRGI